MIDGVRLVNNKSVRVNRLSKAVGKIRAASVNKTVCKMVMPWYGDNVMREHEALVEEITCSLC